ncbi:hypothetical protein JNUCC64_00735 [Streptomyces sp. JNUCC 64]
MRTHTPRLAALVVLPVLALTAACGGGDGVRAEREVASVPDAPATGSATPAKKKSGDGSAARAGKSAFYDAQLTYVRCMRTKAGVKDYPDPKLSGHLDWKAINEIRDPDGMGEDTKGGKNGVCGPELRAAANLQPERDQQKDFESMLAHAKCMRDNGVSRFANPVMSGGNAIPGGEPDPLDPAIKEDSPVYEEAWDACEDKLLDGLDGMQ